VRRFDVLVGWARQKLGLPDSDQDAGAGAGGRSAGCAVCGRSGPPRMPVSVTVSAATLLHLSEEPGELTGWGLIDADTARELAADGEWRRWLVEEGSGRLLDVGSRTYRPSAAMDRFVRGRDRTCRFPNCSRAAVRCDLDHTRAFHTEGGATALENLTTLCRRHHRLKHETAWSYAVQPTGAVVWTAPSGHRYVQHAESHQDIDWTDPEPLVPDSHDDTTAADGHDDTTAADGHDRAPVLPNGRREEPPF
jgi:hypothetical protein